MRIRALISGLISLAIIACFSTAMIAQEVTGTIVGTVKDSNGAGVPGASVAVTDSAKNVVVRTVTTNSDGEFSVPNLSPGTFTLAVEASNFKRSVQTGVILELGGRHCLPLFARAARLLHRAPMARGVLVRHHAFVFIPACNKPSPPAELALVEHDARSIPRRYSHEPRFDRFRACRCYRAAHRCLRADGRPDAGPQLRR